MTEEIKSCTNCNSLTLRNEFFMCLEHEVGIFNPDNGYCRFYESREKVFEDNYNILMRELKFIR